MIGHVYEGYLIGEQIGQGSLGEVHKATKAGKTYAIKTFPIPNGEDAKDSVEIAFAKHFNINNPFIAKYYETFRNSGKIFLVMEYYSKGNLKTILTENSLPQMTVMKIFLQISVAMADLHEHRILHRDIKLENIFLDDDGNIKIGDFGSGKILSSKTSVTEADKGTREYQSPEVLEQKPYDNKIDVWSVGVLLYRLITNKMPFTGNPYKMMTSIINHNPEPIKSTQFDPRVIQLVQSMLQKNAIDRPSFMNILMMPVILEFAEKLGLQQFFQPGYIPTSSTTVMPEKTFQGEKAVATMGGKMMKYGAISSVGGFGTAFTTGVVSALSGIAMEGAAIDTIATTAGAAILGGAGLLALGGVAALGAAGWAGGKALVNWWNSGKENKDDGSEYTDEQKESLQKKGLCFVCNHPVRYENDLKQFSCDSCGYFFPFS